MGENSSIIDIDIFTTSKDMVTACYALTFLLPPEEKTNLSFYIRNAALMTHVCIVKAMVLKKSKVRRKLLHKAKNSLIVIDAAIDVLIEVEFIKEEQTLESLKLASALYQQVEGLLTEA